MKTINVYEYSSGEFLGTGFLQDEELQAYEKVVAETTTGAVKLSDWMTGEAAENVMAQDDTTVWFEAVALKSAE